MALPAANEHEGDTMRNGGFSHWLFHMLFIVSSVPPGDPAAPGAQPLNELTTEERRAKIDEVVNDVLTKIDDPSLRGWRFVLRLGVVVVLGPIVAAVVLGFWRWLVGW